MASRLTWPHSGHVRSACSARGVIGHFFAVDGKPAPVVALVRSATVALSASNVTVAVFLAKSTCASLTPGTFCSDFLTVTGHKPQVMFCTSRTAVFGVAADA